MVEKFHGKRELADRSGLKARVALNRAELLASSSDGDRLFEILRREPPAFS
jgi:hypothetical protein